MSWGLFTASLLFALVVSQLLLAVWSALFTRPSSLARMLFFLMVHTFGIISLPGQFLSPAAYVWSVLSDSSMATFLLISYYLIRLFFDGQRIARYQPVALALVVVLLSIVYYPLALGLGSLDVYSWGFRSPVLIACIGVLALLLSVTRYTMLALWAALGLAAWSIELGETVNMIDYLIDPIAFFWAVYILICHWRVLPVGNKKKKD